MVNAAHSFWPITHLLSIYFPLDTCTTCRSSDKERVKAAIKAGHVAPADVPDSAKPLDWSQMQATLAAQAEMNRTRAAQLASTETHSHTFDVASSSTAGAGPSSQRSAVPAAAGQKRKADVLSAGPPSSSQPSSSQTTARTVSFSASQPAASQATIVIEDSDDEFDVPPIEIVPKDDHYIDFRTVIVGIQYYTGPSDPFLGFSSYSLDTVLQAS